MAARDLPLCITCGAWSPDAPLACGHPPNPQLTWHRLPWWHHLGDFLGLALFTLLLAAVLIGLGPLLWWLLLGWPPDGALETFGAIALALVTLPAWAVGLMLVRVLPEYWPGRRWEIRDTRADPDDITSGYIDLRRGRPVRGDVARTVRAPILPPVTEDMSSVTAAKTTGDLRLVLAAALAGLAARGQLALTLVETTGWLRDPADPNPRPYASTCLHLRRLSPRTADMPWLEGALLDRLPPAHDIELDTPLRDLAHLVALEIGFIDDGDGLHWPADAESTPAAALRQLLLDAAPTTPDDPAPVTAALDAWRTRDPARVPPSSTSSPPSPTHCSHRRRPPSPSPMRRTHNLREPALRSTPAPENTTTRHLRSP